MRLSNDSNDYSAFRKSEMKNINLSNEITRLTNQIKILNEENRKLREEIILLNKKNVYT